MRASGRSLAGVAALLLTASPAAGQALAPPTGLRVEATSASSYRLSWRHPGRAKGFAVLRRAAGASQWEEIARLPAEARGLESTGVLAGQRHEHCVKAIHAAGTSACALSGPVATPAPFPGARGRVIAPRTEQHRRAGEGSIARIGDRLLFVYGRYEGSGDYGRTVLARRESRDDGKSWSGEQVMIDDPHQVALPALLTLDDGTLLLSYLEIRSKSDARRVLRRSRDGGATWDAPVAITDDVQPYLTGSHDRLRRLASGRLVYPVHAFLPSGDLGTYVYVSDDAGLHWRRTTAAPLRAPGALHPKQFQHGFWESAIVELAPGKLMMIGRTARGRLYRSRSVDNGDSWSAPEPTNVLSPIAPSNIIRLQRSGAILLVWEPHVDLPTWGGGARLVLGSMVSRDGGESWSNYRQIEYSGHDWLSYPSLFVDRDGSVNLTYYGENDAFGDTLGNGNVMGGARYLRLPERWFFASDPEPGCCTLP